MKNILVITTVALLVIFSCKKKDDPQPANNSTTTGGTTSSTTGGTTTGSTTTGGTTTGGTTTGGTTGTQTSTATSFHGLLSITNVTQIASSQSITVKTGNAYFSATPVKFAGTTGLRVKKVTLNGDSLPFEVSYTQYNTSFGANFNGSKWTVEGGNGIPTFTFDATFLEPTCTNLNLIPSVISKAAGFTISMTVTNAKTASFILMDETGDLAGTFVFPLTNGANNINITSTQLNGMTNTTAGTIMVQVENNSNHVIGGKDFSFKKSTFFSKQVEIKN